ncbi:endonuclease/exonuclease/phosphatase family protein [Streptomyces sp. TRM66268-LWL]|uniref:Endonuclease/exonuclease/phosphatase family protein n=1 Tax=Streptomyces polyasparticus TaxID=2767826 RepID=A0ABR7SIL4_9ACTN|nr:endonuclease/exonuclease/phosphatase family protein [Streptomyces polyasparticus]MBC9715084.1 endonuclease/exonuclease/phosphatase family protein [Streptomyces polyasparticus]
MDSSVIARARRIDWRTLVRRPGRATTLLTLLCLVTALAIAVPAVVPNAGPRLGSFVETFRPWLGLVVVPVLLAALVRRSPATAAAALVPVLVWLEVFAGWPGEEAYDVTVVQHNVSDTHTAPARVARQLRDSQAELIALEEVTPAARKVFRGVLKETYPHHAYSGTVDLWSRHPLSEVRRVDIRPPGIPPGWDRGLRATARLPQGETAVYVAHLPSVRFRATGFGTDLRDASARLLGEALAAEPLERVLLLGDLNSTTDDRGLDPVLGRLDAPDERFAFSWPSSLPVARIDQVLARGARVAGVRTLPDTGSDHLPIEARIRF